MVDKFGPNAKLGEAAQTEGQKVVSIFSSAVNLAITKTIDNAPLASRFRHNAQSSAVHMATMNH
jgi:predicted NUDIX family NTP pyrophosphohydrolase